MPKPEITLFKTPTADKIIQASRFALRLQEKTSKRGLLPPLEDRFLVRITVDVSGGKKLEAEEVYIDENGDAQTYASGLTFTVANNQPVFSANVLSVGDVVEIKEAQRPDGEPYWLASAASGGGSSAPSNLKFVTNKNAVSGATSGVFDDDAEDLGEFADLAALQAAYPTGTSTQAAKVLTDGFYYTWNGSAWTSTGSAALPQVEYTWKNQVNCKVAAGETMILAYVDIGGGSFEWRADLMIFRKLG